MSGPKDTNNDALTPKATLYIANIDWSIKKPILRRALLALFERHGKVLEVVTLRREGLRGQAWILFDTISSAISAQKTEHGFLFFGKPLKVVFARDTSDRIAKRDGTYLPKDRRVPSSKSNSNPSHAASPVPPSSNTTMANAPLADSLHPTEELSTKEPSSMEPTPSTSSTPSNPAKALPSKPAPAPPSNILFAQSLPQECNEMMLAMLFRQYGGYQQIRMPRAGLAFIEFQSETEATLALKGLNGFQITSKDTLDLEYSR